MKDTFQLKIKAKEFSKIKIPTKSLVYYFLHRFLGVFQTWQSQVLDKPKACNDGYTYNVKIISITYYFLWIKIFVRKLK